MPGNAPPAIPYSDKPTSVAMELTLRQAHISVHQEPFTTPGGDANQIHLGVDSHVTAEYSYLDETLLQIDNCVFCPIEDGINAPHIEVRYVLSVDM